MQPTSVKLLKQKNLMSTGYIRKTSPRIIISSKSNASTTISGRGALLPEPTIIATSDL